MNSTKKRIILTAIDCFNKNGVGNVRVHDISKAMKISPGNLTYHFKTKSDLMFAVHEYMMNALVESMAGKQMVENFEDTIFVIKDYLEFQLQYRFFYRDVLVIIHLCPELKESYQELIRDVLKFNRIILEIAVSKGVMNREPYQGHYALLIKNHWAILHAWLTQREVSDDNNNTVFDGIKAVFSLYFPYLTDSGKTIFYGMMQDVEDLAKDEIDSNSFLLLK